MQVLLIRLREIGDVVFTTPAVRAIKKRYAEAQVTYVVEPHAAPVVSRNPHIDRVIVAPRGRGVQGLMTDIALGRSLRSRRFDLAIDFHGGPRASLLTWLSGARQRIGYDVAGRSWMYTHRVARPRALRPRHSVENQWDLLTALDFPPPDRVRDPVEMAPDPDALTSVAARIALAGAAPTDRLVVIHVSAGNPFRRWPLDHFIALTSELAKQPAVRVVVTSGPSEQDAAARVVDGALGRLPASLADRVLACGEFSLAELRALAEQATLYIGGDSGPLHIASTSNIPIVGLYGPTLPARSAPWRDPAAQSVSVEPGPLPCRPCDQRSCTPGDFRCLTSIDARQVVEAAIKCLK